MVGINSELSINIENVTGLYPTIKTQIVTLDSKLLI